VDKLTGLLYETHLGPPRKQACGLVIVLSTLQKTPSTENSFYRKHLLTYLFNVIFAFNGMERRNPVSLMHYDMNVILKTIVIVVPFPLNERHVSGCRI